MKYLIILFTIICSTASNHLDNGGYSYQYHTDQGSRGEIRHPNGHITGAYNYVDNNLIHKVRYAAEPNKNVQILSHNTYEVFPKDVYHNSQISYRRNLNVANEDTSDQIGELPPVYVRHVPSPVKHEPIVPIIDVAAPFNTQHSSVEPIESAPARRSYQVKSDPPQPEVTYQYYIAPTPKYLVPHYVQQAQSQIAPEVIQKQLEVQAPKVKYQKVIQKEEPKPHHQKVEHRPLLAADVPLTHEGLTYEVAQARDQHLAAVAAIKQTLPPSHS